MACKPTAHEEKEIIVTASLASDPDKLNPLLSSTGYAQQVHSQIMQTLLNFNPVTMELSPVLAKSNPEIKEITEGEYKGGLSLTYEIHEAATWDNGTPILAKDYVFSAKIIFNPKVPVANIRNAFDVVKDIKIDPKNPKRFTVYTNRPYFLTEAITGGFSIYPAYIYDPNEIMSNYNFKDLADREKANKLAETDDRLTTFATSFTAVKHSREKGFVVGSGPYQLEEWITGQRIVLSKKNNWWGDAIAKDYPMLTAHPDKIIFKIVPDNITASSLLKNEKVDAMSEIPTDAFLELKERQLTKETYNFSSPALLKYYYIGINGNKEKLAHKKVRRALAHLIDVEHLINQNIKGLGERTIGPFHPSKPYYHKDLKAIEYDVEKALALFKEAGWTDSNNNGIVDKKINNTLTEMEINLLISSGDDDGKNMAIQYKDWARKGGVNINIVTKDFNALRADYKQRVYDLVYLAWYQAPSPNDPQSIWHTQSNTIDGFNRTGFGNAESDALIEQIRATIDEDKRYLYYKELQEIIYDEQPYIFLYTPLELLAIHKRFETEVSTLKPGYFPNLFSIANKELVGK